MLKGATVKKLYYKTVLSLVNKNKIHIDLSVAPAEVVYLNSINPTSEEKTAFENHVKYFSSILLSFDNVTAERGDVQRRYLRMLT